MMLSSERRYKVSNAAWEKLCAEARKAKHPPFWWFRHKAGSLGRCNAPIFNVSGDITNRHLKVYIPDSILDELHTICERLGVPYEAVGELVCAWEAP